MPDGDHSDCGEAVILHLRDAPCGKDAYALRTLREDIRLGLLRGDAEETYSPEIVSRETVLILCFDLPRTGKGGDGRLPSVVFTVKGRGTHRLPTVKGRGIVLCITESRLRAILGKDVHSLPAEIQHVLGGRGDGRTRLPLLLSPEQVLAGNALLNCTYKGAVENMYLKSKALELTALFFGQLAGRELRDGGRLPCLEGSPVAVARDYLLEHMEDPPSLRRIARHAGINDTKLKRLFKDAYGLSPYAYLRAARMTAAREMILVRGVNVSEAAFSVGYSNVSHFIAAFTRQYGIRPGELRARQDADVVILQVSPQSSP